MSLLYEQRQKKRRKQEEKIKLARRKKRKSSVPFNCTIGVFGFKSGSEIMQTVPGETGMAGAAAAFAVQFAGPVIHDVQQAGATRPSSRNRSLQGRAERELPAPQIQLYLSLLILQWVLFFIK